MANYKRPEDLIGENGLLKQLTKLLVEKALDAEMAEHWLEKSSSLLTDRIPTIVAGIEATAERESGARRSGRIGYGRGTPATQG